MSEADGAYGGHFLLVVPGGYGIHGVLHHPGEAQELRHPFPVHGMRGPRHGTGPQRAFVEPAVGVREPPPVPMEGPGVGQEVVTEQDRLPPLAMGVPGHERPPFGLHPVEQRREQLPDRPIGLTEARLEPQPHVGGDLIVPGSGGVELPAHRAHDLDQSPFDRHVDVLVRVVGDEAALRELPTDPLQGGSEGVGLVRRQQTGLPHHPHVGDRAPDVLPGHAQIDVQGGSEGLHLRVGRAIESPSETTHSPSEIRFAANVRRRSARILMKPVESAWSKTWSASNVTVASS